MCQMCGSIAAGDESGNSETSAAYEKSITDGDGSGNSKTSAVYEKSITDGDEIGNSQTSAMCEKSICEGGISARRSRLISPLEPINPKVIIGKTSPTLRNFESEKGGHIVNRGDSNRKTRAKPRRRRFTKAIQNNDDSLHKSATMPEMASPLPEGYMSEVRSVLLLGPCGVGKTSLCRQFQSSEYADQGEYDEPDSSRWKVSVRLDNAVTELMAGKLTTSALKLPDETTICSPDALIVVYSVVDASSFRAARGLCQLISSLTVRRPVILVASKCDLVRLRKVTAKAGRALAVEFGFKYIETSVVISSNIDDLLAGVVAQIRLYTAAEDVPSAADCAGLVGREQTRVRRTSSRVSLITSLTVTSIVRKVIGQSEHKSCDNLQVL